MEHVLQLRVDLHKPIQPGNTLRGYLSDLNRIRISLEDLGQPVSDRDLIACLINGLRVPEYQSERNHLVHFPQTSFDKACSLCRKTANQDTVVGGVAAATALVAFYSGSGSSPSFPLPPARTPSRPVHEEPSAPSSSTPALVDALTKLTESISLINTQLANHVAVNTSFEDKVARIAHRLDRVNKGPPRKGPHLGGPRPPPPTYSYCGKIGHSVSGCYAKRDADKATTPRAPTTYAATVTAFDINTIHYEAFMAIHHDSQEVSKPPSFPVLSEPQDLPPLFDIPSCGDDFSDSSIAVRYLGLYSGASTQILLSLVNQGRFIAEVYVCDKDPLARRMALAALQQLVADYPSNFSD